jgi:ubiquinol-cytochrome c reductase cytochrome c subunit
VRLTQKISHRIAGRLSAGRRSRVAAPLVLVLGLLVTGGMYAALSPASAQTRTADQDLVSKGRALFLVGCASCHGKNAEGITTVRGGQYGPSLIGVGAAAVDFQVGTGRMPMAQPGPQALRKPPVYDDAEIAALSAYVASLGPGPDIPAASEYDVSNAPTEDIARGGEFFRTNCTACHNFAGAGGALPRGRFAPSLQGVSEKHMYEAMLTGPQQMPVFGDQVLSPQDKRQIIAYLKKNEETPAYGGFTLGSLGPVTEGLAGWLVGMGALTGAAIWIAANSTRSRKKTQA